MEPRTTMKTLKYAVSIQRSPEEIYAAWQDPTQLPAIFRHLLGGQLADENAEHHESATPVTTFQLTNQMPPNLIEWVARMGDEVRFRGTVTCQAAPVGRGTELRVRVENHGTSSAIQQTLALVRGRDPSFLLKEDLRNFKQFMETGEFPTTRGQPCGKRTLTGRALMQWMEERLQRELEHAQPRPAPRAAAQPFQTGVAQ